MNMQKAMGPGKSRPLASLGKPRMMNTHDYCKGLKLLRKERFADDGKKKLKKMRESRNTPRL